MSESKDQFPRGIGLPTQSPLFWVAQKDRYLRQLLIRDIEALTKRRLVVYFANRYENAQIDSRDPALITEVFRGVPANSVDLLIETTGGYTDATESLVSTIQSLAIDFRAIVVNAAKSNGTLLSLASSSIVMGAPSELGPIEPLINDIPCTVLSEPQIAAQNYPLHRFGVHALQQTRTLAQTLLTNGMMKGKDASSIGQTVQALASRDVYFSHGSVINHAEAKRLGLAVEYIPPDNELWQRLWLLYCMYDSDMRRDKLLKIFENSSYSTSIAATKKP